MKNNLFLYFPDYEDIHFYKDVGQIPYLLSKKLGYDFYLLTQKKETISKNKNICYLFYKKSFFRIFTFIKEIFLLQPKISIYFFFNMSTLFLVLITKIFSLSKIYVKGDINFSDFSAKTQKSKIFYFKKKIIFLLYDFLGIIYSVETKITFDFIKYHYRVKNLQYIPNGTNLYSEDNISFKKDNIILTVGRLGTFSKNTQLFLEIAKKFLELDKENKWKFILIGPIQDETNFIDFKDNFFQRNYKFLDKIVFLGPVNDKKELLNYYKKSKIFLMTSRFESSGLVFSEATINGNILATTNVGQAYDITNNGKYGLLFGLEEDKVGKKLYDYVRKNNLEHLSKIQREYTNKNFTWETIIEKLLLKLN